MPTSSPSPSPLPYQLSTLANGLRVATCTLPHLRGAALGLWTSFGGLHEGEDENGVAHFVEHLMFKGTPRRSARRISADIENIGGDINAYTSAEHTCYYALAPARHLPRLADVLCDMFLNAEFREDDIERERRVIREEILAARDQPDTQVDELLAAHLWAGHPLGRPLTGTVESLGALSRERLLSWRDRCRTASSTIVTAAGPFSHETLLDLLRPRLENLPPGEAAPLLPAPAPLAEDAPRLLLRTREIEQLHLLMGFRACGLQDERRHALELASVLLGENMSSRLFQTLRERLGLCYSVGSYTHPYAQCGEFGVEASLDTSSLPRALSIIRREIDRAATRPPSARDLRHAKDYLIGQEQLALEGASSHMTYLGESLLAHGEIVDPAQSEARLELVTPEEVRQASADFLAPERAALLALVAPERDRTRLEKWRTKLER